MSSPEQPEDADTPARPDDYIYVDNLRLVRPYYFDFKCFVKKRWEGMTLVDIFTEEFPMLTPEYYRLAHAAGRLRVEGHASMALDAPLKTSMCIRHLIHRHEPPVLRGDVQVLGMNDEYVAVHKPAGMPVHTVGQYRKNTVLGVMGAEHPELGHLHATYRLDKPVSGVLMLARTSAAAAQMRVLLEGRSCTKVYVARVQGRFPDNAPPCWGSRDASPDDTSASWLTQTGEGAWELAVPLTWDAATNHAVAVGPGSDPGLAARSKPAVSEFRLLSVAPDGLTSVVECRPKTGRTHQLRVHLQFLGHPIANDTQYGGCYGPPLAFRRRMPGSAVAAGTQRTKRSQEQSGEAAAAAAAGPMQADVSCAAPVGVDPAVNVEAKRPRCDPPACTSAAASHVPCDTGRHAETGCDANGTCTGAAPLTSTPASESASAASCSTAAGGGGAGADDAALAGPRSSYIAAFSSAQAQATGPSGEAAALPSAILELYQQERFQVESSSAEALCPHCPCLVPRGYPIDLEALWLHALHYSSPTWSFEAPLPHWADPHYKASPRSAQPAPQQ